MHNSIEIEVDEGETSRLARVHGMLDVFSSSGLVQKALAGIPATAHSLVLDLRDVKFVDSAGVSAVVRLAQEAKSRAIELHTRIGATTKINETIVQTLCRVVPCDDDEKQP